MKNNLPVNLIVILQECGEQNIDILTKNEVFEIIMNYKGYLGGCVTEVKELVRSIYGYNLF